jgi:putative oxidoreductase
MRKRTDLGLLVLRLMLVAILWSHGIPKLLHFHQWTQNFGGMNIPMPTLSLLFSIVAEVGGGLLLLLGVFVEVAAILVMVDMTGAIILVLWRHGVDFNKANLELTVLAIALALLLMGAGTYALGRRSDTIG